MIWRLKVCEALVWLILARILVAKLRFGRWRSWLGQVSETQRASGAVAADRVLARAVDRATQRLPGGAKCLPRAIALHWMLWRRARPSQLVIGVLPGQHRGELEDLHAWVELGEETLIGQLDRQFLPLVRFNAGISH